MFFLDLKPSFFVLVFGLLLVLLLLWQFPLCQEPNQTSSVFFFDEEYS
jgi:hypothetical protein